MQLDGELIYITTNPGWPCFNFCFYIPTDWSTFIIIMWWTLTLNRNTTIAMMSQQWAINTLKGDHGLLEVSVLLFGNNLCDKTEYSAGNECSTHLVRDDQCTGAWIDYHFMLHMASIQQCVRFCIQLIIVWISILSLVHYYPNTVTLISWKILIWEGAHISCKTLLFSSYHHATITRPFSVYKHISPFTT